LLSTRNPSKTKICGPDVGTVEIRFTGFDFPNVETPGDLHGRYYALPIYTNTNTNTHTHTQVYNIICNVYAFVVVLQYIIITFSSSCTPCALANYTTAINTFQLLRDHISPESHAWLCNRSIYFYIHLFIGTVVIDVLLSLFFFNLAAHMFHSYPFVYGCVNRHLNVKCMQCT